MNSRMVAEEFSAEELTETENRRSIHGLEKQDNIKKLLPVNNKLQKL